MSCVGHEFEPGIRNLLGAGPDFIWTGEGVFAAAAGFVAYAATLDDAMASWYTLARNEFSQLAGEDSAVAFGSAVWTPAYAAPSVEQSTPRGP